MAKNKSINPFFIWKHLLLVKVFFLFLLIQSACKKFLDVNPPITRTTAASVYNNDAGAASVLTGIYIDFSKGSFATGNSSISLLSGLSADEFTLSNAVSNTDKLYYYYTNTLFTNPVASPGAEVWSSFHYIYRCNEAIEQIDKSSGLTLSVKRQLLGEAKFIRAFLYFNLVNLYGPIPLALSSDYDLNSRLSRSSVDDVYRQIIKDLLDAKDLLSDHYFAADAKTKSSERVRPTQWAATALLAKVCLFTKDYDNAELQATAVINNSSMYDLVPLNSVFLANSKEAIWQLQPVNSGWNTEDAKAFTINSTPGSNKPISVSSSLYNSIDSSDMRKINWIRDTTISGVFMPYPYKYKKATLDEPVTEYAMVFRLGEQYLIRAEARVHQNKITEAQTDLNAIRARAGLEPTATADKNALLSEILTERRIELFSEWGNRWFDLKRTNSIEAIMGTASALKGSTWQSYQQLYPILYTEIEKDPNLTQNEGY